MLIFVEIGRQVGAAIAADPGIRRVANDREQPRARIAAPEGPEEAERAQIRLLHDILRIRLALEQPAREVVGGIQVGQEDALEIVAIVGRRQMALARRNPRRIGAACYYSQVRLGGPHPGEDFPTRDFIPGGFHDSICCYWTTFRVSFMFPCPIPQ